MELGAMVQNSLVYASARYCYSVAYSDRPSTINNLCQFTTRKCPLSSCPSCGRPCTSNNLY